MMSCGCCSWSWPVDNIGSGSFKHWPTKMKLLDSLFTVCVQVCFRTQIAIGVQTQMEQAYLDQCRCGSKFSRYTLQRFAATLHVVYLVLLLTLLVAVGTWRRRGRIIIDMIRVPFRLQHFIVVIVTIVEWRWLRNAFQQDHLLVFIAMVNSVTGRWGSITILLIHHFAPRPRIDCTKIV